MVPGADGGASLFCGKIDKRQRRGIDGLFLLVKIVSPYGLHTWTE